MTHAKHIRLYTDGACSGNPGPGGYGAILEYGEHRRELSGGYRRTTNNRMELLAAIKGLEALKHGCVVSLISDSAYVVNAIDKGWARSWKAKSWVRKGSEMVPNRDLWARLLDLCDLHEVRAEWVRGHAGHAENERCDELARAAIASGDLPIDPGFEAVGS
jgi:ribonuclease HI